MAAETPTLLVSPDGMLGQAFEALLTGNPSPFESVLYPDFDLQKRESVRAAVRNHHRLVINCSAYTDVDGAEKAEKLATQINGIGVGWLAERCRQVGAVLVHYSTDYVFDGRGKQPYPVNHPVAPLNAYGRSKAVGEQAIADSGCEYLLIRTSWLYAPWASNFVLTMARLGAERPELRVIYDQHGRPTSAEHLAATTMALLDRGARGRFHVTDGGQCSWHRFATEIVGRVNPECRVEPCTSEEFPRPAARPPYSVLDLTDTEALLGPMTPWQQNLAAVMARLSKR